MLKTILDYSIFEHFTKSQPAQVPIGSAADNAYWINFWSYLKSNTDLTITHYHDQENIFLNVLTTGRKGSKLSLSANYKKPHKNQFPKDTDVQTVFFLNEPDEKEQEKYRRKNGFLFGFLNVYKEAWEKLSLIDKPKVLPVRKNIKNNFNSWGQLSEYILPYTDLIIIDNYMLDESLWDVNLFKIIGKFSEKATVKFNLLLVSFAKSAIAYQGIHEKIQAKLKLHNISCNLSIALAKRSFKEHDRGIFTNYLRIKSGDSFVYFDKNGKFLTSGTDIDFHSLSEQDKFNASEAALTNIKKIIQHLETDKEKDLRLFGNLKNGLLENNNSI